jgi:Ni,Fe-hydrogenase III large subunit
MSEEVMLGAEEVKGATRALVRGDRARLADLFGAIEEGQLALRAVYAADVGSRYRILRWAVEGDHYPGLSDIAPAAYVEECEIYEQFGVRPAGGRPLNRIVLPPYTDRPFPRLGSAPKHEPRPVHAPHFVAGEAIEFPFGPVRAVAQESLYVGLVTSGEEVIDLYLLHWHKHRGLERRLQGLDPERALFFVERAEGLSAVGNGWAFCRAVEAATGTVVDPSVERTRAVLAELERIYNHAAAIAALGQATGLSVGQAQAEIPLERLLRLNLAAAGHRYLFGALAVGGVRRAINAEAVRAALHDVAGELRRVVDALLSTNSFVDRLEAAGVVAREAARRLGLVGPVARGSGEGLDCRRDHPFGPYVEHQPAVAVGERGDVLSRLHVMVAEIEESVRLVGTWVAEGLGAGVSEPDGGGPGCALGWSESSRGESLAWVSLDPNGRLERARLRPGSGRNWRAFDDAARSRNVFTDIPIIEASFWLTVAGMAR